MHLWDPEPDIEDCFCPACNQLGFHQYTDDAHLMCCYCAHQFSVPQDVLDRANEMTDESFIDT